MSRWGAVLIFIVAIAAGVYSGSDMARVPDIASGGPRGAAAADDDGAGARIRAHVEFLADDLLEGRQAGTRGYDIAARYVSTELKQLGLEPAGDADSFLQTIRFRRSELERGDVMLTRSGQAAIHLALPADAVVPPNALQAESTVSGAVVFVGFGVSAPSLSHDDYAGLDVRGKVVAMLSGAPSSFPSEERAHFSAAESKQRTAADHGAIGILTVLAPETLTRFSWDRFAQHYAEPALAWIRPDGMVHVIEPRLKGAAILGPDGARRLFADSPVPVDEVFAQAGHGAPRGFALPCSVTIQASTRHATVTSANVVARLKGTDAALADTAVVLSAHLDHIGLKPGGSGDTVNNGAYDNATGSALLLEVARAFTRATPGPRRSVVFVFVTAEEEGLLGSEYFAEQPPPAVGRMVANVNLDMPLFLTPSPEVTAFGAEHSSLEAIVDRAVRDVGLRIVPDPLPEEHLFVRSDQYSFVRQGIPSVYLEPGITSARPGGNAEESVSTFLARHYHQPSDDLSLPMDLEAASRFARLNYLIAAAIAADPVPPAWKPSDFFGKTFHR
jgi:hypothetical protein